MAKECRVKPKNNPEKSSKTNTACNYCKKQGHWEKECRKKLREKGKYDDPKKKKYSGVKTTKGNSDEDEAEESEFGSEFEDSEEINSIGSKPRNISSKRKSSYRRDF